MANPFPPPDRMDGGISIDIPDGIEPLIGYRGWKVREVDGKPMLKAVSYEEYWPPGNVAAEAICSGRQPRAEITLHEIPEEDFANCAREIEELIQSWSEQWSDPHEPPNESCRCGLYARLDRDEVVDGEVTGQIEAWGKIVKGAYGFRAQYARIKGLYLRGASHGFFGAFGNEDEVIEARMAAIQPIADHYGVPILDAPEKKRTPISEVAPARGVRLHREPFDDTTKRRRVRRFTNWPP